jgi:hypothetical protein
MIDSKEDRQSESPFSSSISQKLLIFVVFCIVFVPSADICKVVLDTQSSFLSDNI